MGWVAPSWAPPFSSPGRFHVRPGVHWPHRIGRIAYDALGSNPDIIVPTFSSSTTVPQRGRPVCASRELAVFSISFKCAVSAMGFRLKSMPGRLKHIRSRLGSSKAPETRGRMRCLTEEKEKRFLGAASEPLRSVVILGIHTGLRAASEGLSLT